MKIKNVFLLTAFLAFAGCTTKSVNPTDRIPAQQSDVGQGTGDIDSSTGFKALKSYGYKCIVKKGTLKFTPGKTSEAYKKFYDLSGVSIFNEVSFLQTKFNPSDSLAAKPVPTLVSVSGKSSTNLYNTIQKTNAFDLSGHQLKLQNEISGKINIQYTHGFVDKQPAGVQENLFVTITDWMETDHWGFRSAKMFYEYKSSTHLPSPVQEKMNGRMDVELSCKRN